MSVPFTSSYLNFITIVMILYVSYNGINSCGKYWIHLITDSISTKE